jgi:hypothetical protein
MVFYPGDLPGSAFTTIGRGPPVPIAENAGFQANGEQ